MRNEDSLIKLLKDDINNCTANNSIKENILDKCFE